MSPHETMRNVRTPKRSNGRDESRSKWFHYYAGFSSGFVEDALSQLNLRRGAILLDPWLGAGTTAEVAVASGYQLRGYDLNPSMLVVAKARTLPTQNVLEFTKLAERASRYYERPHSRINEARGRVIDEPLEQWLQPSTARAFRRLERIVAKSESPGISARSPWASVAQLSPAVSLLYVALFRTLRHFISSFQSSNPTWVKVSDGTRRVQISQERMLSQFSKEVVCLGDAINSEHKIMPPVPLRRCMIEQASSTRLPLRSNSVDAVISSPPYCTRIDYVRATLPELAVIGFPNGQSSRKLREQMIGSPTISNSVFRNEDIWGPTCNHFLSQVESHFSKASSSYYIKYYRQYFAMIFASLTEISRVLKKPGLCTLVVQDSFYKDVRNDLPSVFSEMASQIGWKAMWKMDFPVGRSFAGIHPKVRQYRDTFDAIESVLTFRKG